MCLDIRRFIDIIDGSISTHVLKLPRPLLLVRPIVQKRITRDLYRYLGQFVAVETAEAWPLNRKKYYIYNIYNIQEKKKNSFYFQEI